MPWRLAIPGPPIVFAWRLRPWGASAFPSRQAGYDVRYSLIRAALPFSFRR